MNQFLISGPSATLDAIMSLGRGAATAGVPYRIDRWFQGDVVFVRWVPESERRAPAVARL